MLLCVPQYFEEVLKYCNYVFTVIFVIEAILKLIAFGLRRFFKERYSGLSVAKDTSKPKRTPTGNRIK